MELKDYSEYQDFAIVNLYRITCRMINKLVTFRDFLAYQMKCDMNEPIIFDEMPLPDEVEEKPKRTRKKPNQD